MRRLIPRLIAFALLCLPAAALAASDFLARTLTPADAERLARYEAVRSTALKVARERTAGRDAATLQAIIAGEPQPILGIDIRGTYRCRFAKLDGVLPLIVYGWFDCTIREDDIGYRLEKTSGSQRLTGHFVDDSKTSLVFYGAGHYRHEAPRDYNDDPARNIVGRFVKVGEDRFRLELPLPNFDSRFDILDLERAVVGGAS